MLCCFDTGFIYIVEELLPPKTGFVNIFPVLFLLVNLLRLNCVTALDMKRFGMLRLSSL